jgi:hypothetical protein
VQETVIEAAKYESAQFGKFIAKGLLLAFSLMFIAFWPSFESNETEKLAVNTFFVISFIAAIAITLYLYKCLNSFLSERNLVINSNGIVDSTQLVSSGFVPWKDVTNIRLHEGKIHNCILIDIKNPEIYFDGSNNFQNWRYKRMYKTFGTPIVLSSSSFAKSSIEIQCLLNKYFKQAKSSSLNSYRSS